MVKKRIRVSLIMGPFLPIPPIEGGAVEKLWYELSKSLASDQIKITVVSKKNSQFKEAEVDGPIIHKRVKGYGSVNSSLKRLTLDFLYALRAVKATDGADIIITNTFWAPIIAKFLTKSKVWVSVHRFPRKQYWLYKNVDLIQPVSNSVAKGIISQEPKLEDLVKVLPNFIHISEEKPVFNKKRKVILFVGRLHPEKGVENLITAFKNLPSSLRVGWELRIVGPHEEKFGGGGDDYLQQLKLLSSNNATFTGAIFDKKTLNKEYLDSSIFVYPSISDGEALPLSPLEAMSFGCQTILSNLDCFDDYLIDNVNGYKYKALKGDNSLMEILEKSMLNHATDEHLRMFNESIKTAESFDIKNIVPMFQEQIKSLYEKI